MPDFSISRGRVLALGALALVLLYVGGKLLAGRDGGQAAVPLAPVRASAPAGVVVHVVGAVRRPGLYTLKHGARIADAVARAGGARPKADLALVNLAAAVADGQQIVVPARAPPVSSTPAASGNASAAPTGPVRLNTATQEQLDALPGVGPVTAQKILDYRQKHGAFSSVDDLDAIPGIGPARLAQLRELVAP